MVVLLREAAARGIATGYVRKLLAAFDVWKHGRMGEKRPSPHTPALIEPLSDRELDVLHLLADGQTNQEIAQALCVSVNTIKTHLKNIYRKLGVNSRREATAKAKKQGLVKE